MERWGRRSRRGRAGSRNRAAAETKPAGACSWLVLAWGRALGPRGISEPVAARRVLLSRTPTWARRGRARLGGRLVGSWGPLLWPSFGAISSVPDPRGVPLPPGEPAASAPPYAEPVSLLRPCTRQGPPREAGATAAPEALADFCARPAPPGDSHGARGQQGSWATGRAQGAPGYGLAQPGLASLGAQPFVSPVQVGPLVSARSQHKRPHGPSPGLSSPAGPTRPARLPAGGPSVGPGC